MSKFLLALFFAASFAVAQPTPPANNTPGGPVTAAEKKNIRLEGNVLSSTGDPVGKATLQLQNSSLEGGQLFISYTQTTNEEGKFVFEDVAPGRYTLSATKAGFVLERFGARAIDAPGTILNLSEGQTMKDLSLKMTPQGVIRGKITDQDGDPVTGAQVQAMRYSYLRGRRELATSASVTTNDQGDFRVANLPPGRYYISAGDRPPSVSVPPTERTSRILQEGNVTTYFPNGLDASSAAPVEVTAGAELRGIDFRLRRERVYWLRGKAVDAITGAPASTAIVSFLPKDACGICQRLMLSRLSADGVFEYRNLLPGSYVLQAMPLANASTDTPPIGRLEVTIADSNVDGAVLLLTASTAEITGSVKLDSGDVQTLLQPRTQNSLAYQNAGAATQILAVPGMTVSLALVDGLGNPSSSTQIKGDGAFRLTGTVAGKLSWSVSRLPEGVYVKSVRFRDQDVTHSVLDNTAGTGGVLDILLSPNAADASGVVHNDKGEVMAGAIVTLWPKKPDAGSATGGVKQTTTDQNGGFKFSGLAPGDYYVAAWEELGEGLATYADFLALFNSDATAVKLVESRHEIVDAPVVPRERAAAAMAQLP